MFVVIAFESLFGNTRLVAEAVAEGLSGGSGAPHVLLGEASTIDPEQAGRARLLVVGGPTHYHGLASRSSIVAGRQQQRRVALTGHVRTRGGEVYGGLGPVAPTPVLVADSLFAPPALPGGDADLRAWLRCLPEPATAGSLAAAFDTRVAVRWAGGAAYAIARRLRRRGYHLAVPAQGFLIDGLLGPVRPAELAKAAAWGGRLRRQLAQ